MANSSMQNLAKQKQTDRIQWCKVNIWLPSVEQENTKKDRPNEDRNTVGQSINVVALCLVSRAYSIMTCNPKGLPSLGLMVFLFLLDMTSLYGWLHLVSKLSLAEISYSWNL